jgi:serine/threonine protein phosphatase PrpC
MRVREGDLLLLATDGVYDNLFSDEILNLVKSFTAKNTNLKTKASAHILARSIAEAAFLKSKKTNIKTPF